jgi:hypothetical protein
VKSVTISNQPTVHLDSVPLASGSATEAKQDIGNSSLASIDTKLTNPLPVSGAISGIVVVSSGTVAISSSALPSGAATQATLFSAASYASTISSTLTTLSAKLDNLEPADAINEYSITCTAADTEYSQALPAGTKKIFYINTAAYAYRASYVTGKVATPTHPYEPLGAGMSGGDDRVCLTSKTIYFASTHAGDVIFLRCWI